MRRLGSGEKQLQDKNRPQGWDAGSLLMILLVIMVAMVLVAVVRLAPGLELTVGR